MFIFSTDTKLPSKYNCTGAKYDAYLDQILYALAYFCVLTKSQPINQMNNKRRERLNLFSLQIHLMFRKNKKQLFSQLFLKIYINFQVQVEIKKI